MNKLSMMSITHKEFCIGFQEGFKPETSLVVSMSMRDAELLYSYLHGTLAPKIAKRDQLKTELDNLYSEIAAKKRELQEV